MELGAAGYPSDTAASCICLRELAKYSSEWQCLVPTRVDWQEWPGHWRVGMGYQGGDKPAPVREDGDKPAPVREDGDKPAPLREDGGKPAPV